MTWRVVLLLATTGVLLLNSCSGSNDPLQCPKEQQCGQICCEKAQVCNSETKRCECGTQTACADSDGCCPKGCRQETDSDCAPGCGNGVLDEGEICDTAVAAGMAGACPFNCDDGVACTSDLIEGAGGCSAVCVFSPLTTCQSDDGCCPSGCNSTNDNDCSATCGNGTVENNEKCDTAIAAGHPGACVTSCEDGVACTRDVLLNGDTCAAECTYSSITQCQNGDACCPVGCNGTVDSDCVAVCGNGLLEGTEKCDTAIPEGRPGACPTQCNDWVVCTLDARLNGGTCAAECSHTVIASCNNDDDCCPSGCDTTNDNDCSAGCGNGYTEEHETCETNGVPPCPTTCDDGVACTTDTLINAGTCNAECMFVAITQCVNGDQCCPTGCDSTNDDDCSPTCGNGVLDPGETCDTAIAAGHPGACPVVCYDGASCMRDVLVSAGTCSAECTFTPVTTCGVSGDRCCPNGCTHYWYGGMADSDCTWWCGDGDLDPGEKCDPLIPQGTVGACPENCDDGVACTLDSMMSDQAPACQWECSHIPIMHCINGDGCCPAVCTRSNDDDCSISCGDGVLDTGEACDTAIASGASGACPTSCDDGLALTLDMLLNGGTCAAECSHIPITSCVNDDGYCPRDCYSTTDNDCPVVCGNGVLENGETCDTAIAAGSEGACPTTCNDGMECTEDVTYNMGTCTVTCAHFQVPWCCTLNHASCGLQDGCCPAQCSSAADSDCVPICGNGGIEPGEKCDTAISAGQSGACPTTCPANSCLHLSNQGTCDAECIAITTCQGGDSCCPSPCDGTNDTDCSCTWYVDCDSDGLASNSVGAISSCPKPTSATGCSSGLGSWTRVFPRDVSSTDCDDSNPEILALSNWFEDCDGDGFAPSTARQISSCYMPDLSSNLCSNSLKKWTAKTPVGQASTDCNDENADVYPGQTNYFESPIQPGGGYDYDCNNVLDGVPKRHRADTIFTTCLGPNHMQCVPEAEGWSNSRPACGQIGYWVDICYVIGGPGGTMCEAASGAQDTRLCH